MNDIFASHKSLEHFACTGKKATVEDETWIALNRSFRAPMPSFLEGKKLIEKGMEEGLCSISTFESLHNFKLRITNLLKECTMAFLDFGRAVMDKYWLHGPLRAVQSMETALQKSANSMMAAIEEIYLASNRHIDSPKKSRQQLNVLVMSDGQRGMPDGKDNSSLDMVFVFVTAFLNRRIGI